MTTSRSRVVAAAGAMAVAAAVGASLLGTPAALAGERTPVAPPTALNWGECPDFGGATGQVPGAELLECATLEVPLDYAAPDGKTIEVAVSRLPARDPDERRGAMLLNPGGPGGPGLDMPLALLGMGVPASVLDTYDLVGFDPRGIGRSSPVTCGLTAKQVVAIGNEPFPEGPRDVAARARQLRENVAPCGQEGADPDLPYMTTANTARDMDRIRVALGEERISYYGLSYGSYLGAVYAELFTERTDRVVLDSAVGPDWVWREEFRAWGPATELAFPDFAKWAAARSGTYELGDTRLEVRRKFFELAERLDEQPVAGLDGAMFRTATRSALYDDATFPLLAQLWQSIDRSRPQAARQALAAVMPKRAPARAPEPVPGNAPALDSAFVGGLSVLCNDAEWPSSVGRYQRDVTWDRILYPMYGPIAANVHPCAFWPYAPREQPVQITDDGPANVLILQNRRDPATIYHGAVQLREKLDERAAFVSVDAGGHGVYLVDDNACANNIATQFLVDGELPRSDRHCDADELTRTLSAAEQKLHDAVVREVNARQQAYRP